MNQSLNILGSGATGSGKSQAAAGDVEKSPDAEVVLDPEKDSFAATVMTHLTGNVLYDRLDDPHHALSYDLLSPSKNRDPLVRDQENQRSAEAFTAILLRRRDKDSMASTPLMEEWVMALMMLFLYQGTPKPLTILPNAFMPGTAEFKALVQGCVLPAIRDKFSQLEGMNPRALRAEIGSAARLVNAVVNDPSFRLRCGGALDLGGFLQAGGKLVVEGGDAGDDAKHIILGGISLKVTEHAKRRPRPFPIIRVRIDEALSAGLVGKPELRGIAQTRKYGLFWHFMTQDFNFPDGHESVFQNCKRHEFYGFSSHKLARIAATDLAAGIRRGDKTRSQLVEELTDDLMGLKPGWRWVRDPSGSRKEYVPMLQNPWPNWPGLREAKMREKLCRIHQRLEYRTSDFRSTGDHGMRDSFGSSPSSPPPDHSSPLISPAERWRLEKERRAGGSHNTDVEGK